MGELVLEVEGAGNRAHVLDLVAGHEGHGNAGLARPARSPGAVDVILSLAGRVEVNDLGDVVDVDTAGSHVGRHEGGHAAGLKRGQRLLALTLALVAVHRGGGYALGAKALDEPVGAALGAHEDESEVLAIADLPDELLHPRLVVDSHEAVLDLGNLLGRRNMLVLDGLLGVLAGDAAGLAVEGRREEERLAPRGALGNDPVDGRAEAHVEHAVGLVQDEDLHVRKIKGTALEEVLEPARRGNDNVRLARLSRLLLQANATVDGGDLQRPGMGNPIGGVDDLGGELTGRGEDERRRARVLGVDPVDQRHHEGEGLARAGRRLGQHVAAGENVADHLGLDGERGVEALLVEGVHNGTGYAEIGEGLL